MWQTALKSFILNNMKPLVSVIITTYNRANLIDRAIEGVLKQDYPNIELIVVDDCSTDNTENHIKERWEGKVKYIRHERNMGVQYASNTGFRAAKGEYLAFIGDDDKWIDKDKLSEQVKIFESDREKRYGIVTTAFRVVRPEKSLDKVVKKPKNLLKHLLTFNGIIPGSAAVLRREAFERAGKFVEELPKGTDSDVFRRIVLLGYDAYFIKKIMVEINEGRHPRITPLDNEKTLIRAIKSQKYNLERYSSYLEVYPSAKSYRLYLLGSFYEKLWFLKKNKNNLQVAKDFYTRSIFVNIFNYRAWYKLITLFLRNCFRI